jgi:23S rRNA (adenine2503-C2)-methyltransferase
MNIYGKTLEELSAFITEHNYPKYMGKQLADWMYKKHTFSFAEMSNISKKIRNELESIASIDTSLPDRESRSQDGTVKYLFSYPDKGNIEAVYIPEENRHTLCISSQAGCKYNCDFCMTGKMGFKRNLSAGEIINQFQNIPERELITNIVYMGMGEPLDNYNNVIKSLEIFTSDYGFGIGNKRLTLSTIGLLPQLKDFLNIGKFRLALSLHSPFEDVRRSLMPVEKVHSFETVLNTIRSFDFNADKRFSIEYIMLKGVNDRPEDVNKLTKLLHGIPCRINLIRYHKIPGNQLQGTSDDDIEAFKYKLRQKGIQAMTRKTRGQDIEAACGMLSGKYQN